MEKRNWEKKMGSSKLWIWNLLRIKRERRKKSWGLDQVVYLNNKRFTIRTKEKNDGFDWIVDLKLSKKWKGKWEKKMGVAKLCIWNVRDLLRRKKKMGVGRSCVFE